MSLKFEELPVLNPKIEIFTTGKRRHEIENPGTIPDNRSKISPCGCFPAIGTPVRLELGENQDRAPFLFYGNGLYRRQKIIEYPRKITVFWVIFAVFGTKSHRKVARSKIDTHPRCQATSNYPCTRKGLQRIDLEGWQLSSKNSTQLGSGTGGGRRW